jgi:hypothetical protein
MSLSPLEWRKLPARIFPANITATSSYFLDTIYDMLTGSLYSDSSTRTLGSGSAWQMPVKFVTGSNTEAIYVFPGFQTAISQSVIIACKSRTGASSSAAVPVVTGSRVISDAASGGAMVLSTSSLYGAVVKNASGSFTQWTSLYPFGSGSYSTAYAPLSILPSAGDKIVVYESKEAISVITQTAAAGVQIFIAGAIIDPEQSVSIDTELDGRLYGLVSAAELKSATGPSYSVSNCTVSFLTDAGAYSPFTNTYDYNDTFVSTVGHQKNAKFVAFRPQSNAWLTINAEKFAIDRFATINPIDINIETPLRCYATSVSNNFVGRLRDIVAIKNRSNNETLRSPNNSIIGYTISRNETLQAHTMCLKY